jgi:hypothetical protein
MSRRFRKIPDYRLRQGFPDNAPAIELSRRNRQPASRGSSRLAALSRVFGRFIQAPRFPGRPLRPDLSRIDLAESAEKFGLKRRKRELQRLDPRDHHIIMARARGKGIERANRFPEAAPNPVPHDGFADFLRDGKAKPRRPGWRRNFGFLAACGVSGDQPRRGLQREGFAMKALPRGGAHKIGASLQTMRRCFGGGIGQNSLACPFGRMIFCKSQDLRGSAHQFRRIRLKQTTSCGRAPGGPR